MLALLMLAASAAFGAADQYLGSLSAHPWAVEVSLLSAPWLLLPFLAGATQRTSARAALTGSAVTLAALVGYGLMTLSPVEGAHLGMQTAAAFVRSEAPVFAGGAVTGPLFGWLGGRWHTDRAMAGPLITAAAFCLEPVAHVLLGSGVSLWTTVSVAEGTLGLAVAGSVLLWRRGVMTPKPGA